MDSAGGQVPAHMASAGDLVLVLPRRTVAGLVAQLESAARVAVPPPCDSDRELLLLLRRSLAVGAARQTAAAVGDPTDDTPCPSTSLACPLADEAAPWGDDLTTDAAARLLEVSQRHVRRWLHGHPLRSRPGRGRALLVSSYDVEAFRAARAGGL